VTKIYKRDSMEFPCCRTFTLDIPESEFLRSWGLRVRKTTLLNLIAGIDRPNSGSLVIAGRISRHSENRRWQSGGPTMSGLFSSSIPSSRAHCVRERRIAATADQSFKEGKTRTRGGCTESCGLGRQDEALSETTFRRAGTTGCDCPCHRYRPYDHRRR